MNLFNQEIVNWMDRDEINYHKQNNENHGIIQFYEELFEKTHHTKYIDDFPTLQSFLKLEDENINSENDSKDFHKNRKKIAFFIDFLKSEQYLEIIPRLTVDDNKIHCVDHLVINRDKSAPFSTDDLITQSSIESIDKAQFLIQDKYHIDENDLHDKIHSMNPLYILYLPYYFLMENFRTAIDPVPQSSNIFKTIRRDKQIFLNNVYNKLIERNILTYDTRSNDIQRLHGFFHFAWTKKQEQNIDFLRHYINIYKILLNDFLLQENSPLHYKSLNNEHLNEIIAYVHKQDSDIFSVNKTFDLVKIILSARQKTLLKHSKEIETNPKFKFIRNILIELILHNFTIQEIESNLSHELGIKIESEIGDLDDYDIYLSNINVHYHDRSIDAILERAKQLENLKEILLNPANYDVLFTESNIYEQALHPFYSLLEKYKKYKKHFIAIFPQLKKVKEEEHQLHTLLHSFKKVGLIVHILLPEDICKELNMETDWYVESFFWNDIAQKNITMDHFRKEYKFSTNDYIRKINDECLNYLSLSLGGANKKTATRLKSKRKHRKIKKLAGK